MQLIARIIVILLLLIPTVISAQSVSLTDGRAITLTTGLSLSGTTLSGKVAQIVTTTTNTSATGSTLMPVDNSIPQSNEGDEYITLAITPVNASSTLLVRANVMIGVSTTARYMGMALFRDAGTDAVGVTSTMSTGTNATNNMSLEVPIAAGSTSATTFKIRIGPNSAATVTFNGANSARIYGAIPTSTMSITEILP